MKADTSRRRLSRNGCPSAHFLIRRGLANYCEPQGSSRMSRADMFGASTGRCFEPDYYCAGPGQKKSNWDIC
ncbi:MAG: hypothetical protein ACP5SH_08620 [Syntrophobacteraceae bacterium]